MGRGGRSKNFLEGHTEEILILYVLHFHPILLKYNIHISMLFSQDFFFRNHLASSSIISRYF